MACTSLHQQWCSKVPTPYFVLAQFLPGFTRIAAPLTDLHDQEKQGVGLEAAVAAKTLIAYLTSYTVLALPDFNTPFVFTTDITEAAVADMLSQ